jgi:hypothetical protein
VLAAGDILHVIWKAQMKQQPCFFGLMVDEHILQNMHMFLLVC